MLGELLYPVDLAPVMAHSYAATTCNIVYAADACRSGGASTIKEDSGSESALIIKQTRARKSCQGSLIASSREAFEEVSGTDAIIVDRDTFLESRNRLQVTSKFKVYFKTRPFKSSFAIKWQRYAHINSLELERLPLVVRHAISSAPFRRNRVCFGPDSSVALVVLVKGPSC